MEHYERIKLLGEGSFGKVYLMRHREERKLLCMKVIKIKNIPRKEREACRMEVELLKRLHHPNIVGYRESFLTPRKDCLCIAMEYCDGGDLCEQIKGARRRLFSESKILHFFVQMSLGLHYMHSHRILHRDLKTQNVFLLGNGRVVLGDLGISKVLNGTMDFASTCIGTPYYMSPEIFKNEPYNHKSDVWALGCVLYEMTTLNHAFDSNSLNGLASKIVRGKYPPINPKYSPHLRDLIASMLATSPAARPDMDQILRHGFIKRHIHNFLADIMSREQSQIGEGTMVVKAAAVNLAGGGGGGRSSRSSTGSGAVLSRNRDMQALQEQMEELGLQSVVARALQAGRAAREQASALHREEDRKRAVEAALARLRSEREQRLAQRQAALDAAKGNRGGERGGGGLGVQRPVAVVRRESGQARARPKACGAREGAGSAQNPRRRARCCCRRRRSSSSSIAAAAAAAAAAAVSGGRPSSSAQ
ncbi:kinase-like domain-containing protein [Tribonema minus]|uniref:non-specific serine/threonine protein kinase n=1 Tax=Tribonema minus TaxID=303371 RepID=A0A836CGE2_9STRA|nr:kinase-like domain-containing protein [Tribonema minus]